jgi:MIP family channel proteins
LYGSALGENVARAAVAEAVGTFLLVLAGTAVATAATLERPIAGVVYDSLAVALAFGLVLASLVSALGHVSGAHLNPAVTIGLSATGKFPWRYVPAYVGAQLVGATLAAAAVWFTFGDQARDVASLAATYPAEGTSAGQAFVTEALITFLLVFVIVSVATDERAEGAAAGPAVGFALAVAVLIGGPVTGGAVNPARALGPMLLVGRFTGAWIYVLAPVAGGVLAALLYDRFVSKARAPEADG